MRLPGESRTADAAIFLGLCLVTAISLVPIVWGLMISVKQEVDAFSIPPKLIFQPTLEFHHRVWFEEKFFKYLTNSLIISGCTVCISVPIGAMAGYALSRIRTRRSRSILFGLLVVRMLPPILIAIPFFVMAKVLRAHDTYWVIVLAMVATNQPFTIWLMRSFFLEIPTELDEAARIDGAREWQIFLRVLLPVARPGIVVACLFSLLLSYNEFLFPLILSGAETKPLSVAIAGYVAEDISYWSVSAAGAIGIMLPIILFMAVTQRHMVRGLTSGAIR